MRAFGLKRCPKSYDAIIQALAVLTPPGIESVEVRMEPGSYPDAFIVQMRLGPGSGRGVRAWSRRIDANEDDTCACSMAVDAMCGRVASELAEASPLPPSLLYGFAVSTVRESVIAIAPESGLTQRIPPLPRDK